MVIAITSIALVGAVSLITLSVVASDRSHVMTDARLIAQSTLSSPAVRTSALGGATAPSAPVDGFNDRVLYDPAAATLAPFTDGTSVPDHALVVRRQWRVWTPPGSDITLIAVTVQVLTPDGARPASGSRAVEVRLAEVIDQ